jgi:4-amino-4-deoxy-L-arabinose transferase-like glycosyltransferase
MTRKHLLTALWLVGLMAYCLAGTPLTPFHGDESTQIYMSRDYAYQFIEGEPARLAYDPAHPSPQEQDLRLINGTLPKYLIGLAWHGAGFSVEDLNEQWDWGADWDYNHATGHAPSAELLLVARWSSAVFLAAGVLLMFGLGQQLGGAPVAYLASAYYALNPALLLNGRRAMMEGALIFFSLLVVVMGLWFLRRRSWPAALGLGIASGLCIASKHTGIVTVGSVIGAIGLWLLWEARTPQTRREALMGFIRLVGAGLSLCLSFYALNPAWWGQVQAVVPLILQMRTDLLQTQTALFGQYADFGAQAAGFFRQVFVGLPQYYEVAGWDGPLAAQITQAEASGLMGIHFGGSAWGGGLLLALTLYGIGCLWRSARLISVRWLISLWGLGLFVLTFFITPLEWQRYYLPILPFIGLMAALGLGQILAIGWRRLHNNRAKAE